MEGFTSELYIL